MLNDLEFCCIFLMAITIRDIAPCIKLNVQYDVINFHFNCNALQWLLQDADCIFYHLKLEFKFIFKFYSLNYISLLKIAFLHQQTHLYQ